ncbi:hypothetical protein FUAX_39310 (plasmid) [Fulvitalea axinellae]|uniref:Lipoprotein n=1 Tax=Fulvitalea axinellae TaxID=1182444 RepID=A0AAU9CYC3_9BACT|nr:hypothetical protein FUAX_39310 [Fulvitalea axinellae]
MKRIGYVFLLFTSFSCNKSETLEKEVSEILFSVIRDNPDLFSSNYKLLDFYNSPLGGPSRIYDGEIESDFIITSIFNKEECKFLSDQKKANRKLKIIRNNWLDKNYRLISSTEINTFREKFQKDIGCIQGFSVPLISKDRQFVIIRYFVSCGSYNAHGFTSIFKYTGSKWIEFKNIENWIS